MEETGIVESKKKARGKPFDKGFDPRRNINGHAKKGFTLAEKFRNGLEEQAEGYPEGYTKLDLIIDLSIGQAIAGNSDPLQYVLARAYGKMLDRIEIGVKQKQDLSKLSPEEYAQLKVLTLKTLIKDVNGSDDSTE